VFSSTGASPHDALYPLDSVSSPPRPWWLFALAPILVWNASAGPHVFDAGELVAAAWQLGASHPPGQPTHALLGHLVTWLPVGPIHFRVALLSVATELLAAYLVARLTHDLLRASRPPRASSDTASDTASDSASDTDALAPRLAPHVAALGALVTPPLLAQTTRVEVYGLALVFSLVSMRALVAWWQTPRVRSLLVGAFAAGLAAAVHPPHGLALVALGFVFALARWRHLRPRALVGAAAMFLLAALALVHLPLRALAGAPMWGQPTTWASFVDYVTARAYAQNVGVASDHALWDQTGAVVLFLASLAPVALLSALAARRWVLLLGVLATTSAAMLQPLDPAIPDMVAYLGPAVVLLVALGAASIASLSLRTPLAVASLVALGLPGFAIPRVLDDLDAHHPELETLAAIYLESPTPRSVVVVDTDFVAAAWMEARAIEGARPDALLVISGLITSSWHWDTFASHPVFDGTPIRGPGDDPREAFLLGVGIRAKDQVDVVSELDRWGLPGARGPYAQSRPTLRIGRDWLPKLAMDAWPVEGDGAVSAILRHAVARHAQRLVTARRARFATIALSWLVELPTWSADAAGPVPIWVDADDFLTSEGDARRLTAVALAAGGDVPSAMELLGEAPEELDVVQLAAMQLALGDVERARRTVASLREPDAVRWAAILGLRY
jgi:hypothetical protein